MADEEKNGDEENDGAQKGSRKLLIFGLIGGLVAGGGATFGVITVFFPGGDHAVEEVEPEPPPEIKAFYISINRLPASLIDGKGKLLGYLFIDMTLEVDNAEDRDWVLTRMPLVRDAFLRSISADGVMKADSLTEMDHDGLPKRLRVVANRALKREIITNILVTNALRTEK